MTVQANSCEIMRLEWRKLWFIGVQNGKSQFKVLLAIYHFGCGLAVRILQTLYKTNGYPRGIFSVLIDEGLTI
jgi:hypothetical protein